MKLVVWFRNGTLYKAQACSRHSWRRTANAWNEYAELWNKRFGYEKNVVGVIPGSRALEMMKRHKGLPKHAPPDRLLQLRNIRELMRVAPWGKWTN